MQHSETALWVWEYWDRLNSLAAGRSECNSKNGIFNLVLLINVFRSSHDNDLWWLPQELTDDKSTLVQVMAWCRQATSYYLSQCWLSPLSPHGVARPQWFNFIDSYTAQKKPADMTMTFLFLLLPVDPKSAQVNCGKHRQFTVLYTLQWIDSSQSLLVANETVW